MLRDIETKISTLIPSQLPNHLEADAPNLGLFLQEYYEWLERTDVWALKYSEASAKNFTPGKYLISNNDPTTSVMVIGGGENHVLVLGNISSLAVGDRVYQIDEIDESTNGHVYFARRTNAVIGLVEMEIENANGSFTVGEKILQRFSDGYGELVSANSTHMVLKGISGLFRPDIQDKRIYGNTSFSTADVVSVTSTRFLNEVETRGDQYIRIADRVYEVNEVFSDYMLRVRGRTPVTIPFSTYTLYTLSNTFDIVEIERRPNALGASRRLPQNLDVDRLDEHPYLDLLKKHYLHGTPHETAMDSRTLIKHVLDLYRTKGIQVGFELLFRVIYDENPDIYFPGRQLFDISAARWQVPQYVEVTTHPRMREMVGKEIRSSGRNARAIVENYMAQVVNGKIVNVLTISNVEGTFSYGDTVICPELDIRANDGPIVIGSLTSVSVINGGYGYEIGDVLDVLDEGVRGKARVAAVRDENGRVQFTLISGGFGYSMNPSIQIIGALSANTIQGTTDSDELVFDGSVYLNPGWVANGAGIPDVPGGVLVDSVEVRPTIFTDTRTGDGTTDTFSLTLDGSNTVSTVTVGGVLQVAREDYEIEGKTITFYSPPGSGNSIIVATPTNVFVAVLSQNVTVANNVSISFNTGGSGASFEIGGLVDKEFFEINDDTILDYYNTALESVADQFYLVISNTSVAFSNGSMIRGEANVLTIDASYITPGALLVGETVRFANNDTAGICSNSMGSFVELTGWDSAIADNMVLNGATSGAEIVVNSTNAGNTSVTGFGTVEDHNVDSGLYDPYGVSLGTNGYVIAVSGTYDENGPSGNNAGYFYPGMNVYSNNTQLDISSNTGAFSQGAYLYQSNGTANIALGIIRDANTTAILVTGVDGVFDDSYEVQQVGTSINAVVSAVSSNTQTATVDRVIRITNWDFPKVSVPVDAENLDSTIDSALTSTLTEVGTISFITNINPGVGYSANPVVKVIEQGVYDLRIPDGTGGFKGFDAIISANAGTATGIVQAVEIVDSGLGYIPNKQVRLSNPNNVTAVTGASIIDRHGVGEGRWLDRKGFLNEDFFIQDSKFYQKFSYEVIAPRDFNSYEQTLRETFHPSGIALFGSYRLRDFKEKPHFIAYSGIANGEWTPLMLGSDLLCWYDASNSLTITTDANNGVSSWIDVKRSVELSQNTAANRPTMVSNSGLVMLEFANNHWMRAADPGLPEGSLPSEIWVLGYKTVTSGTKYAVAHGNSPITQQNRAIRATSTAWQAFLANTTDTSTASDSWGANLTYVRARFENDVPRISVNGAALANGGSITAETANNWLSIGSHTSVSGSYFEGGISSIVITRKLSDEKAALLDDYFSRILS